MKILIEYEASWRNSFLDGSNNKELPKGGRKFIGSSTELKKAGNLLCREVTIDTVMGILNRLIGDQKKLYQSRRDPKYFFKDIEPFVGFEDKPTVINNDMTYIRNITGSTDPKSYTGMIKNHPSLTSDYSKEFWGILGLDLVGICRFISGEDVGIPSIPLDPIGIADMLENIGKMRPVLREGVVDAAHGYLDSKYEVYNGLDKDGSVKPKNLYCSALYLQAERISTKYNLSGLLSKKGCLSGVSKNDFTKKDFMGRFTSGSGKKVWGNPYLLKKRIKGEGEVRYLMTKASGTLEINIDIDRKTGKEIRNIIENAGVSSFYLGKKGLAYVSKIRV